jgi:hypothetical protein
MLVIKGHGIFMLFDSRKRRLDLKRLTGIAILVCYLFLVSSINLFHSCGRSHAAEREGVCVDEHSCCVEESGEQRIEKVSHHNGLHGCPACAYIISNQAAENSGVSILFAMKTNVRQVVYETFLLSQDGADLLRGRGPPVSIL